MKANPKLLRQVNAYVDWAQGISHWHNLRKMMGVESREELLRLFAEAEDVLPLVQKLSQAVGYTQAIDNMPFAYGFTDPSDVCGRQIERKAGAI